MATLAQSARGRSQVRGGSSTPPPREPGDLPPSSREWFAAQRSRVRRRRVESMASLVFTRPFLAVVATLALARAAVAEDVPAPRPGPAPEPEGEVVIRGAPRVQAAAAAAPGAAVTVVDAARFAGEAKGAGGAPRHLARRRGDRPWRRRSPRERFDPRRERRAGEDPARRRARSTRPRVAASTSPRSRPSGSPRVEVVRGTEGVHHGTGALGGVVNVVTAAPRPGSWSASATGGSFGTYQADAQGGGRRRALGAPRLLRDLAQHRGVLVLARRPDRARPRHPRARRLGARGRRC